MNLKELFNRRADIRFCFIVIFMLILSFLLNSCFYNSYDNDYEEHDIIYTSFNNDDQLEMHAYNYTKTFALFRVKIPDEYFDNSDGTISVNENSWIKYDDYYYYNGIINYRDGIEDILYTFRPSDSLDGNSYNVRYKYDFYEYEDNLEFVDVSEFEDIWSIIDKPKEVNMIEKWGKENSCFPSPKPLSLALLNAQGISPSAEGDLGLRPKNPRAF